MSQENENSKSSQGSSLKTVVGKGTVIEGKISIQSSGRIDGIVRGEIVVTNALVIGEDGEITGDVICESVVIAGKVDGNVYATTLAILESRSVLRGDLIAPKIVLNVGSFFNGHCKMIQSKERSFDKKSQTAKTIDLTPGEILTSR